MVRALAAALSARCSRSCPAAAFGARDAAGDRARARRASSSAPPAEVVFSFDEAVEASFGALKVFDASGQEVQTGERLPPGRQAARRSRSSSSPGSATAPTPRPTASSPPTGTRSRAGSCSPSARRAVARRESLDELLAGGGTGPVTNTALGVARAVQYGAIALGLGALIFFVACWRPTPGRLAARSAARLERLIAGRRRRRASCPRSSPLILQGAVGAGRLVLGGARPDVVSEVLEHPLRPLLGLRRARLAIVLALAARPLRPRGAPSPRPRRAGAEPVLVARRRRPLATAPPAPAPAAPPRSRDAARSRRSPSRSRRSRCCRRSAATRACSEPVAVLLPANVLHVLAMAAWLGGDRRARARPARRHRERSSRSSARRCWPACRPLLHARRPRARASCCSPAPSRASSRSGSFGALLDTAFGRAVLIKIVIALGDRRARRAQPPEAPARAARTATTSSPGRTGWLLRRTLQAELALGIAAIAATGALSSYAPSTAESPRPVLDDASTSAPRASR